METKITWEFLMIKYIFMTEEKSMEETLKNILPKISDYFNESLNYKIIPHEGKQDLEKSIPKKLRAWKDNKDISYKFIILRDKDSGDYNKIKENLRKLCMESGRGDVLIRIAIHELESWFLGDLKAIDKAYNIKKSKEQNKSKYKNPDKLANPSQELARILKNKSKISWAKNISKFMDITNNKSHSFNVFIKGVRSLLKTASE